MTQAVSTPTLLPRRDEAKTAAWRNVEAYSPLAIGIVGDKTKNRNHGGKVVCCQSLCIVYDNYSECECTEIVHMLDEAIHPVTNIQ